MKEKLFVYGTLREDKTQLKLLKRNVVGITDVLVGYRRSTIQIKGKKYPIAIVTPKNFIRGIVLEITPKELKKIDDYETKVYKRVKRTLKSGTDAWVYIKF